MYKKAILGFAVAGVLGSANAMACTPVSGVTIISSPGVYCLTQDITAPNQTSAYGVKVQSSDVVLDLNGYTIQGASHNATSSTSYNTRGVEVHMTNTTLNNVTIKNGTISGFNEGANIVAANITVTDINFIDILNNGLAITAKDGFKVTNNTFNINQDLQATTGYRVGVTGINVDCRSARSAPEKNGSVISGNQIVELRPGVGLFNLRQGRTGIYMRSCHNTVISDNFIAGGTLATNDIPTQNNYNTAIHDLTAKYVVADNNIVSNFRYGFSVQSGNTIARNNVLRNVPSNNLSNTLDGGGNVTFYP